MQETSTKPYFMRAIYEWCTDNGYTPYLAVKVTAGVRVPMEFVRNGEIVLNISFGATSSLKMDNDQVSFKARFGGISRDICIPVGNVIAIYASENGQGMAFEVSLNENAEQTDTAVSDAVEPPAVLGLVPEQGAEAEDKSAAEEISQKKPERPSLKIVK
ncbi:ClpXP protease specificity-enhancing factor [Undibacterium luofuense]|uniref:ClpXP protease specificity-enhancing factor n=1 Tax=Undibacterium luofuense TaxID=2828733 RepID=A0A941DQ76_9BURK|nr:ClpXP protease specificity-enhancing factor [Undibacterium luofuense]MBR7783935.1 ClpXP protease specificity-enhancing factor [Undibacterium luofuense]